MSIFSANAEKRANMSAALDSALTDVQETSAEVQQAAEAGMVAFALIALVAILALGLSTIAITSQIRDGHVA